VPIEGVRSPKVQRRQGNEAIYICHSYYFYLALVAVVHALRVDGVGRHRQWVRRSHVGERGRIRDCCGISSRALARNAPSVSRRPSPILRGFNPCRPAERGYGEALTAPLTTRLEYSLGKSAERFCPQVMQLPQQSPL
jgi:hypothetical protein